MSKSMRHFGKKTAKFPQNFKLFIACEQAPGWVKGV